MPMLRSRRGRSLPAAGFLFGLAAVAVAGIVGRRHAPVVHDGPVAGSRLIPRPVAGTRQVRRAPLRRRAAVPLVGGLPRVIATHRQDQDQDRAMPHGPL